MDLPFHLLARIADYSTTKTLVNIHKSCTVMRSFTQEQVTKKKKKYANNKFVKQTKILIENFQNNKNPTLRKKRALYALFEYQLYNIHIWKEWNKHCMVLKGKVEEILTSTLQIPEFRRKRFEKLYSLLI